MNGFQFPLAVTWALEAAAQPAITETTSLTAPTAWTYVRAQDVNTCQIYQEKVSVSYAKESVAGQLSADATTGLIDITEVNPVQSEFQFQLTGAMQQLAWKIDYTFLNGSYQQATSAAVAAKTRGIVTACSSNSVNASSATLSKDLMNTLVRTMAGNGAVFNEPVIFANGFQIQKLSDLYGYAPPDRTVGGVAISTIWTSFAKLGVVYAPNMVTSTLLIADLSVCRPVFLPKPPKGVLFYEELGKTGAGTDGQIYGQIGLDYGPEEFHGKITSLATS